MARRYAEDTKVPISRSIDQIRFEIEKYGGHQFVFGQSDKYLLIGFTKEERQVRFQVNLTDDLQRNRALARSILLVIKANLEAAASGVQTFEDAFLANIVLSDGRTVAQHSRAAIATSYETGSTPPLLPDYSQ